MLKLASPANAPWTTTAWPRFRRPAKPEPVPPSIDRPPSPSHELFRFVGAWSDLITRSDRTLHVLEGGTDDGEPAWFPCPRCGLVLEWEARSSKERFIPELQRCSHALNGCLNVGAFVAAGLRALHAEAP